MKGEIDVKGLRLTGYHGVDEQERIVGNTFSFDISLSCDFCEGAVNDDINGTINYADIIEIVKKENSIPSRLLENLAWRIAESLKQRFPTIEDISVKVAKILPPIINIEVENVGVKINM